MPPLLKDETRYQPFGVNIGLHSVMTQSMYGVIYFMPVDDEIIMPHLVCSRYYEPRVAAVVRHVLDRDSVFVDIGANFGYFTVLAAALIGSAGTGRVVSCEPNPGLIPYLRKNLSANWSLSAVDVHEAAVSDSDGEAMLCLTRRSHGNGFLSPATRDSALDRWKGEVLDTVSVRTTTADSLLLPFDRLTLMKIDVEGSELAVFRGLAETLQKHRDCLFISEWSQGLTRDAANGRQDLLRLWQEAGLTAFDIEHWRPVALPELLAVPFTNVLLGTDPARIDDIARNARIA